MGAQTINVSAGAARYVGGTITETTGKDISADTVVMSLGTATGPAAWVAPDEKLANVASVTVKMLVTSATAVGTYFVWARITDSPEVEPFILDGPIYVV